MNPNNIDYQPHQRSTVNILSNNSPCGPILFDKNPIPNKIYKFIVGKDSSTPVPMTEKKIVRWLQDPFANLLLKNSIFPLTAEKLIEEFEKTKSCKNGLNEFTVSYIAEGGQISWSESTEKVDRSFRLLFNLQMKGEKATSSDVFISTGKDITSETKFLQLMSWDPTNKAFNFYQRLNSQWIWSGNSYHALKSKTRGKGPFCGHINGGPVMKELKMPWQNWSSTSAKISATIFAPNDPFRHHRFFTNDTFFKTADDLEKIIRTAISQINDSRIEKAIKNQKFDKCPYFLRQILDSENLNLTSSSTSSKFIKDNQKIFLPNSFFINFDAFSKIFSKNGLEMEILPIEINGKIYKENLKKFNFCLEYKDFEFPGDTHFAFLIPEPAFEDIDLLEKMIDKEMISDKLAACLLMVDFSNPIFSKHRKALISYIPSEEINIGNRGVDLEEKFLYNLKKSNRDKIINTPEHEFLMNWHLEDWKKEFNNRISTYFKILQEKVNNQKGYDDIVLLAESRRANFKEMRLFEFPLTFPKTNQQTNINLEMTPDGEVRDSRN